MTFALKIKALVEGVKDILGLKQGVSGVRNEAKKGIPDPTPKLRKGLTQSEKLAKDFKQELAGVFSLAALGRLVSTSANAVRRFESSFRGLEAVANHTGIGIELAWAKVTDLTADGLLLVSDAAKSLQNLLSRGYNLDEAVQTIERLKDSAAFNRAAHLSLSEAVVTATQGLKNENSILVDNAGVTKNVSVLWKEYAQQIGKTVGQLTQQERIQAEVNGILRETEAQVGNAAKAAAGAEGNIADYKKASEELSVVLGDSLLPAITTLTKWGKNLINDFFKPGIAVVKAFATYNAAYVQSIHDIMDGNFDEVEKNIERANKKVLEYYSDSKTATVAITKTIKDNVDLQAVADRKQAKANEDRQRAMEEELKLLDERVALSRAYFEAESRIAQDAIERQITALDIQLEDALISYRSYYSQRQALAEQAVDAEIRNVQQSLDAQRAAFSRTKEEKDQLAVKRDIAKLETELTILQRRRGDAGVQSAHEQAMAERELAEELEQVRIRLLSAQGQSGAARTQALEAEFRELTAKLKAEGDTEGQALIRKLFNIETARAQLNELQQVYSRALSDLHLQEQNIDVQREAGLISELNARQQIVDLHQRTYEEVSGLIPKMQELAEATGDPAALQRVKQMQVEMEQLGIIIDEVATRTNDMIKDGLADAFYEVGRSIHSAEDFFRAFARSVVDGLQRIAAEALATQIFSMFGGNSIGSVVSAAVNHAGGIGGRGVRREVPVAAFIGAPRYHDGNARKLLGLKQNEVTAVIEDDEEVVTRNNPRHILNQQGGGKELPFNVTLVDERSSFDDYAQSPAMGQHTLIHIQQNAQTIKRMLNT